MHPHGCSLQAGYLWNQAQAESVERIHAQRSPILLAALIIRCSQSEVKTLAVDPSPAWLNETLIPEQLQAVALDRANLSLSSEQWRSLSPLQRFALIKLSRPGHESHNFIPALKEFGLMES